MADVELFWDPVCPFCWVTSKWVRQVQAARASEGRTLDVDWRLISLRFMNEPIGYEGRPDYYPAVHARGTDLLRVAAAIRADHGHEPVGRYYEALGNRIWERPMPEGEGGAAVAERQLSDLGIEDLLADIGLDRGYAVARDDDGYDDEIRAETTEALERVGGDVGTPIITFRPPDGPSFFGPVIADVSDSPEEAGRAWDALETLATWPGFSELKRTARAFPVTALTSDLADRRTTKP